MKKNKYSNHERGHETGSAGQPRQPTTALASGKQRALTPNQLCEAVFEMEECD